MFEVGIAKEEQIQDAIANICSCDSEQIKLVLIKATEFQLLLEELRKAGVEKNKMMATEHKRKEIETTNQQQTKNNDLNIVNNKSQRSASKSSQAEIDKINEEMKQKIPNFHIASFNELGFKNLDEKLTFDCFFKEYVDDTIRYITIYSLHYNAFDDKITFILIRRIDVCILILYRLFPFIMVHNRTSVFDQIHSVQLAMTLINFKDSKHWYNEYKDAKWETEIVNIGKGEHLNMISLSPDLFINSQIKDAWNELYSKDYEGNLSLIVQYLAVQNKSKTDYSFLKMLQRLTETYSYKGKTSLNKLINLSDCINIFDIHLMSKCIQGKIEELSFSSIKNGLMLIGNLKEISRRIKPEEISVENELDIKIPDIIKTLMCIDHVNISSLITGISFLQDFSCIDSIKLLPEFQSVDVMKYAFESTKPNEANLIIEDFSLNIQGFLINDFADIENISSDDEEEKINK